MWSGYFTSRPNLKKHIKTLEEIAHYSSTKCSLDLIVHRGNTQLIKSSNELLETLSLMMHHDTITGTSLTSVVSDYVKRINMSIEKSMGSLTSIINNLAMK